MRLLNLCPITVTMYTESTTTIAQKESALPANAFVKDQQLLAALHDLLIGIKNSHVWLMLGYHDIKLRYRRSVLGPFWITLSMAITVYSMGLLYGHLFHNPLADYFPFLAGGMLAWALLSTFIIEVTEGYIIAENLIKQIKLPYSLYIHRIVWRNFLIFFHNLAVMIPIIMIFHEGAPVNWNTLLLIPHLGLFYINAFCYGLILAMVGARYRDLSQMIKSLVQVAFFMTPVMWNPALLAEKYQPLIACNPFYAFVELIRAPLIGRSVPALEYLVVIITTFLGMILALRLLTKYRSRIVYWL